MSDNTIETARLTLRPPVEADLDDWARFSADATVMRFLGGPKARSEAWHDMATVAGGWALHGHSMFSVIERATGRWIGRIGPWRPEGWPGTEVGWGLARDAWGSGYAVEAARASIDWAVTRLGWTDIIHVIDPANLPSAAVAAKLGAVNRGPGRLPQPYQDAPIELWGQTAAQWRQNREQLYSANRRSPSGSEKRIR